MKPHKWANEIKHWADGGEVQWKATVTMDEWVDVGDRSPMWHRHDVEFRIKPQPKEPRYLYVFEDPTNPAFPCLGLDSRGLFYGKPPYAKIKLEQI